MAALEPVAPVVATAGKATRPTPLPKQAKCTARDVSDQAPLFSLGTATNSVWITPLVAESTAESDHFLSVHENLLHNPNIISSHLFRAEILFDSDKDGSDVIDPLAYCCQGEHSPLAGSTSPQPYFSKWTQHMKVELRPRTVSGRAEGYTWTRTVVRNLVPRNPNLDKPLVQTCHFLSRQAADGKEQTNVILQLPHVDSPEEMPFYHPAVSAVAFMYQLNPTSHTGVLSVTFCLFPDCESADPTATKLPIRLQRTALNLVQLVHKHMVGRQSGYQKRVHHDQVVPQARFQDTYTELKVKYAKSLIAGWKEDTDPAKHVFEDLAIAAFLIELWRRMYPSDLTPFPGFVDIGCGNGLLVDILNREGFYGWGFDVRARKSWANIDEKHSHLLQEMILVPPILDPAGNLHVFSPEAGCSAPRRHNGLVPKGTFIVSNHADQLTVWTPLLAYLSSSPFIAIPCCSHDFSGAKFRARQYLRSSSSQSSDKPSKEEPISTVSDGIERGSLKQKSGQMSAYGSLCSYIRCLSDALGYESEQEILRIPSTRNTAIIGRVPPAADGNGLDEKMKKIKDLVESEMETGIEAVADAWEAGAEKMAKLRSRHIPSGVGAEAAVAETGSQAETGN